MYLIVNDEELFGNSLLFMKNFRQLSNYRIINQILNNIANRTENGTALACVLIFNETSKI